MPQALGARACGGGGALRALVLLWIVFAGVLLLVRHVVLPSVGEFRAEIAAAASKALGLPVAIDAIEGRWDGWRPRLVLQRVSFTDEAGQAVLQLPRVDATLAWSSLLRLQPHFHRLEIASPEIALRREPDGRLRVAGLAVSAGGERDRGTLDWLLAQRQIVIHDARVRWDDRLRGARSCCSSRSSSALTSVSVPGALRCVRSAAGAGLDAGCAWGVAALRSGQSVGVDRAPLCVAGSGRSWRVATLGRLPIAA
ncbi:AsmA family protein [Thauera humireducens]|uniref:YhdP family protein n=1 Tax=Thauera humireducens TaxID=1134435 RepID=UPI00311DC3F0